MQRIRYLGGAPLQMGSEPGNVKTYHGAEGEEADVPDEVASLLVTFGRGALVSVHLPTATTPPAAAVPAPAKTARRSRKRRS